MQSLVLRFSAMGDVALLAPVLQQTCLNNKEQQLTMVSRPQFSPLFRGLSNLNFFSADFKGRHKGLIGLWRLAGDINQEVEYQQIFDMHGVLRSRILCFFLRLRTWFGGASSILSRTIKVFRIDKGRRERQQILQSSTTHALKPVAQRYLDTLGEGGYIISWPEEQKIKITEKEVNFAHNKILEWGHAGGAKIAIAPFAKHFSKTWPIEYTGEYVEKLSEAATVFLLGGGVDEEKQLAKIAQHKSSIVNLAGQFNLEQEMAFLSQMDLVVTMDSANMHLAAFCGSKLMSIWGGTHPHAGFLPVVNELHHIVQNEKLDCRPCSIFGVKQCPKEHFKCMKDITVDRVLRETKEILGLH